LRERFGREVALEVDWDTFIAGSEAAGWPLYPLNIQRAGVERLLYAITGLMDRDEKFKTAARDRIESLYIANASDIKGVRLRYRKGRLTYRCFAGDWNGYYSIDKIRWDLKGRIVGKTRIRKLVERWMENLSDHQTMEPEPPPVPEELTPAPSPPVPEGPASSPAPPVPEGPAPFPAPPVPEGPAPFPAPPVPEEPALASRLSVQDKPGGVIEDYDASLRAQLESLYDHFIRAVTEKDLDGLLDLVRISKTDEETLRREMSSDGFVSFAEWMLTVYPSLEQTTFVSLKSEDDGLSGYYMAWAPPYSDDYLNLTLITFEETGGRWRIVFRISGTPSAILQVRKDEDVVAKAQEVMKTNPLLELKHPETADLSAPEMVEAELSEEMSRLKAEFQATFNTMYRALEDQDLDLFLSAVVLSDEDEEKLRRKTRNLFRAILENTPDPSEAIFVTIRTRGEDQAGFYFAAPYPQNPSFFFVYLKPFVYREGRWRMVFSLEHDLAMNMSIATSEGDLPSRAMEVIDKIDLLNLEFAMSLLFEDIIQQDSASSEDAR
jgi:hypothetical protein